MNVNASNPTLETMILLRNVETFSPAPVLDDELRNILAVARWTGSSMNRQPWEFIVVRDPDMLRALAETQPNLAWLAGAPLAIVVVMAGQHPTLETFDEGRLTERIMLAAASQGLVAGLSWPDTKEALRRVVELLGTPEDRSPRSIIGIGNPTAAAEQPPAMRSALLGREPAGNRKPLSGMVFSERYGVPAHL